MSKKVFYIIYDKTNIDNLVNDFNSKASDQDNVLYCDDLDYINRLTRPMTFRILKHINEDRPNSLNELAEILEVDRSYITKAIRPLVDVGIVTIEDNEENDKVIKKPKTKYNSINVEVQIKSQKPA